MATALAREDKVSDAFLVLGSQYYVHARYSARCFYLPVSATLFHHAVEMLLKGYLAKTSTTADLKKAGHKLVDLWELFKSGTRDIALRSLDNTIYSLDRVELLRYPDCIVDEGYALHVSLQTPSFPIDLPGAEQLPQYYINVGDLDAVVIAVFKACGVHPGHYFKAAPRELSNALPVALRPDEPEAAA